MTPNWPIPDIDIARCDGCGACIRACPQGALRLQDGVAVVRRPAACRYDGCCEQICRRRAISRRFVIAGAASE